MLARQPASSLSLSSLALLCLAVVAALAFTAGGCKDGDSGGPDPDAASDAGEDGAGDASGDPGRDASGDPDGASDGETDPGPRCGDGIAQADRGEDCDGDDFAGATCVDLGYGGGALGCSDFCRWITAGCTDGPSPVCGDGAVEAPEACDGDELGGADCADLGFSYGALACSSTCGFDPSRCNYVPVCGDGRSEGEEECDDGNLTDGDGCSFDCRAEFCGDGLIQPEMSEECDSGNAAVVVCEESPDRPYGVVYCGVDCRFGEAMCPGGGVCGDGEVQVGEACDDGNTDSGDGCRADCTSETCGNGILDPGEVCDGREFGESSCSDLGFEAGHLFCEGCAADVRNCRNVACGDGRVEDAEECDDGNAAAGDGCDPRCRRESCGDGVAQLALGEECDGDDVPGYTCVTLGYGGGRILCDSDCTLLRSACAPARGCGDGTVDEQFRETCDDGNAIEGDGCSAACRTESCGDGIVQAGMGEECEEGVFRGASCLDFGFGAGNLACGDDCRVDTEGCRAGGCGDGIADPGEECDDGNAESGDGCAPECVEEFCGDGFIQEELGEECDAGNAVVVLCEDSPGRPYGIVHCTAECVFGETICPGAAVCGDGVVELGEACDDGNGDSGDGCASDCTSESCGNGVLDPGEACDGEALGGAACADWGFPAGDVACGDCAVLVDDCRFPVCGDGVAEGGEGCDDGNDVEGDGCSPGCAAETCGDGVAQADLGEQCDGTDLRGAGCRDFGYVGGELSCDGGCVLDRSSCITPPACGDGELVGGETCDDGNREAGDGCSDVCRVEECGDGIVQAGRGEACEPSVRPTVSCSDLGFADGELGCSDDCGLDTGACRAAVCGDGVVEGEEACDDGNTDAGDGCSAGCSAEFCGDGVVSAALEEQCEPGVDLMETCESLGWDSGALGCGQGCRFAVSGCHDFACGDGLLEGAETCDEGRWNSDTAPDACRTSCVPAGCGDGARDTGEACDDGAANSDAAPDACRTDCRLPYCGDGVADSDETCDEGEANGNEGGESCRTDCVPARCGDGIEDADEACDEGLWNSDTVPDACRLDCSPAGCGDGARDTGEACDLGGANSDSTPDGCRTNCSLAGCGDGVIDSGEQCDEGASNGNTGTETCRLSCRVPSCGDDVEDAGEECDEGRLNSDLYQDACRTDCSVAHCGDGVRDTGEACDGGAENSDSTPDACRTDCVPASCGDGVRDSGEACDAGAANDDAVPDACRTDCSDPSCGDGVIDSGELCDDGAGNSDALPNACRTICRPAGCGDGVLDADEECDDANNDPGDWCGETCDVEIAPLLDLFADGESRVVAPGAAEGFDATSASDADGIIVSTEWDFGDGATGSGATASHAWSSSGTYRLTVVVTDDDGHTASDMLQIVVNTAPTLAPAAAPSIGCAPLAVSFDANSADAQEPSVTVTWNFGDGSPEETGETASHSFAAGRYDVTVTAIDSFGATTTATLVVLSASSVAGAEKTWVGVDPTSPRNWGQNLNWCPNGVPNNTHDVVIPDEALNQPLLNGNYTVRDLTVEAGAALDSSSYGLIVMGNASGTVVGAGLVTLRGVDVTVAGTFPSLTVNGDVTAAGDITTLGELRMGDFFGSPGSLRLGAGTVLVGGNLVVAGSGELFMTDPATEVIVNGATTLDSATSAAQFTSGTLRFRGDVTVLNYTALRPDTDVLVRFEGTTRQAISVPNFSSTRPQSALPLVEFENPAGFSLSGGLWLTGEATILDGVLDGNGSVALEGDVFDTAGGNWSPASTYLVGAPEQAVPAEMETNLRVMRDWTLQSDVVVTGSVTVDGETAGSLDNQQLANLRLGGHRLELTGDFTLEDIGWLHMENSADHLLVGGNFYNFVDHYDGFLSDGLIEVRGNFSKSNVCCNFAETGTFWGWHAPRFPGTGGLRIRFSGSAPQTFYYDDPTVGGNGISFPNVEVANPTGVAFTGNYAVTESVLIEDGGIASGAGTVDLYGDLIDAAGGGWRVGATVLRRVDAQLPGAMATALTIRESQTLSHDVSNAGSITTANNAVVDLGPWGLSGTNIDLAGGGLIVMTDDAALLEANGSLTIRGAATATAWTAGTLLVRGNLTVNSSGGSVDWSNVNASGTHTLVFDGTAGQTYAHGAPVSSSLPSWQNVEFSNPLGVVMSGFVNVRGDATIEEGALSGSGRIRMWGGLVDSVGGGWRVATTDLGNGASLETSALQTNLNVYGATALSRDVSLTGNLLIDGTTSALDLADHSFTVSGNLSTADEGVFISQHADAEMIVLGNVFWAGDQNDDELTDGLLRVTGNFQQDQICCYLDGAFAGWHSALITAHTNHRTEFVGEGSFTLSTRSMGLGPTQAHFNDVTFTGRRDIVIGDNFAIGGDLVVQPGSTVATTTGGMTINAVGAEIQDTVFTNVRLAVQGSSDSLLDLSGLTFRSQSVTAVQFSVTHPGAATPFTLDGFRFETVPTSGVYVSATDTVSADGNVLTLEMTSAFPAVPGTYTRTAGGAVVTW